MEQKISTKQNGYITGRKTDVKYGYPHDFIYGTAGSL